MQFIDLQAQQTRIRDDIDRRTKAVLDSGNYINGPDVAELESRLCDFTGAQHCVACSSGTDALLMALMAYDIGPGDAVFTSPFTFVATAEVVALLGATPVFVDIDEDTWNMHPDSLEAAIENVKGEAQLKPTAIIPVDIFGLPCDYNAITAIADKHKVVVLEDAAQSFGASYKGKRTCSDPATISATSFFPAKPLGCYGDGGAVFCNDDDTVAALRSIRNHGGGSDKYHNVRIGLNGRLDTLQAAILLAKLEIFEDEINRRQEVAQRYRLGLGEHVKPQHVPDGLVSAWAQYSFMCDNRDKVMAALRDAGIPTAIYYPIPLHLQDAFTQTGEKTTSLPVCENVAEKIMAIPFHPYLDKGDQKRIIDVVNNVN